MPVCGSYVLIGCEPHRDIGWKNPMDSGIWTNRGPYVDAWEREDACRAHIDNRNLNGAIPVRMKLEEIVKRFGHYKRGLLIHPSEKHVPFGSS